MHRSRRFSMGACLVGLVGVALPWRTEILPRAEGGHYEIMHLGVAVPMALVLAAVLAPCGMLAGRGNRMEPLARPAAWVVVLSGGFGFVLAVVAVTLIILDERMVLGVGPFLPMSGGPLAIYAGWLVLRREM